MSGKKYVPYGVYLVCDKGTLISQLRNLNFQTTIFGEGLSTVADKKLAVNFTPFGACAVCNGAPCTAPVTNWMPFAEGISINGNELLLENSELKCASGGTIKIFLSLQAAQAALPKKKKSFWDYFSSAADTVADFGKGFGKGLWKGLKGTVVGVYDLTVWVGKHTPTYALINPVGYIEQAKKDWETAKVLGDLAVKAGKWGYRNSLINAVVDPQDYALAQQENAVMVDALMEKASNMSAEEWGDFAGQVVFEIATEVATAGSAAALTAVKVADKAVDAAKLANRLDDVVDAAKAIDKIDDFTDAAKTIDKIEDAADVGKPLKLGEPTYKVKKVTKKISKRLQYLGKTPGKNSKTGREVFERMLKEKPPTARILKNGKKMFKASNGKWYDISKADMSHITDAVTWWNKTGRKFGAKSKEVRKWMLDSKNYRLDHYSINRSAGAKLKQTYKSPLK